MNVTVVGSGNGGLAIAYDWAHHGHTVNLAGTTRFTTTLADVAEAGGITATGQWEGFVPIAYSGPDMARALEGAELVVIAGPAFATEPQAELTREHLTPDQAVVVIPTSCLGSAVFKKAAGLALASTQPIVGETSTLPYAVRKTGPAHLNLFKKIDAGITVAGLPSSGTPRLHEILAQVYPTIEPAKSVFETTLANGNPVIHPAVTLLNAAHIERTGGAFEFYAEGVTESVGRLMASVDAERLAIADALGVSVLPEPDLGVKQGYMTEANYTTGYSTAPGFAGIAAQPALDHRYLTEDAGYSLVLLTELARVLGVPTPTMDAVIQVAGVVLDRDFRAEDARSLASAGLDGLSADELRAL